MYILTYGQKKKKGTLNEIALAATLVRANECTGHSMRVASEDGTQWIQFTVTESRTTDRASSQEFRDEFIAAATCAIKKHLPGGR